MRDCNTYFFKEVPKDHMGELYMRKGPMTDKEIEEELETLIYHQNKEIIFEGDEAVGFVELWKEEDDYSGGSLGHEDR